MTALDESSFDSPLRQPNRFMLNWEPGQPDEAIGESKVKNERNIDERGRDEVERAKCERAHYKAGGREEV